MPSGSYQILTQYCSSNQTTIFGFPVVTLCTPKISEWLCLSKVLCTMQVLNVCSGIFVPFQMTVFRVLFNHWKEFVTHRSKIPEGEDPREHFAELLRRHRADNKSRKEASERRRMARLSAERKKKENEEREKKRIEDLARSVNN